MSYDDYSDLDIMVDLTVSQNKVIDDSKPEDEIMRLYDEEMEEDENV